MPVLASLLSLGPRSGAEDPFDTTLDDAREALAFWSARRSRLPWYRRAARAEARTMVWRWRARLIEASLEQAQLGFVARRVAPLISAVEHGDLARAGRVGAFGVRLARRTRRTRRLLLAAVAATAVAVLSAGALLGFIAAQLF